MLQLELILLCSSFISVLSEPRLCLSPPPFPCNPLQRCPVLQCCLTGLSRLEAPVRCSAPAAPLQVSARGVLALGMVRHKKTQQGTLVSAGQWPQLPEHPERGWQGRGGGEWLPSLQREGRNSQQPWRVCTASANYRAEIHLGETQASILIYSFIFPSWAQAGEKLAGQTSPSSQKAAWNQRGK